MISGVANLNLKGRGGGQTDRQLKFSTAKVRIKRYQRL